MDPMLRNALRRYSALRSQLDNLLLGDNGDVVETELRKFVAMRPCWQPQFIRPFDFNPARFIGTGWKWAPVDADERSLDLTEVDFSKVHYETCLNDGEPSITGEEKLRRLIALPGICLDPRFGVALLQENGQKTLERLHKERGITYLDFFGQVLVDPGGNRCVLCLCRDVGGRWYWSAGWLVYDWDARGFSAHVAS